MIVYWSPKQLGILNRSDEVIYASLFYKFLLKLQVFLQIYSTSFISSWTLSILCCVQIHIFSDIKMPVEKVFSGILKVSKLFAQSKKYWNVYVFSGFSRLLLLSILILYYKILI